MLMLEKIVIVVFVIELIVFFHIDKDIKRDEEIKVNEKQSEMIIPHKEEKDLIIEELSKEEIQEEVSKKPELSEEEKRQRAEERKRREEKRIQEEIDDVCPHVSDFYDAEEILEEFEGLYFDYYEEVEDFVDQYCKIE